MLQQSNIKLTVMEDDSVIEQPYQRGDSHNNRARGDSEM